MLLLRIDTEEDIVVEACSHQTKRILFIGKGTIRPAFAPSPFGRGLG